MNDLKKINTELNKEIKKLRQMKREWILFSKYNQFPKHELISMGFLPPFGVGEESEM